MEEGAKNASSKECLDSDSHVPLVQYSDPATGSGTRLTSPLAEQIVKLVLAVQSLTVKSIMAELETNFINPMKNQLANAHERIATLESDGRIRSAKAKKKYDATLLDDAVITAPLQDQKVGTASTVSSSSPAELNLVEGKDLLPFTIC